MPDYSSSAWLRGRIRKLVYVPPNKRMQLRGALGLRNIGLCTVKKVAAADARSVRQQGTVIAL